MRRIRSLITGLAFVFFSAVTVAAFVHLLRTPLPAPGQANPRELQQWLASRDLSQESPDQRRQLVARLEQDLDAGRLSSHDVLSEYAELDRDERQQFLRNWQVLTGEWYRQRASEYFAQPEHERREYLDRLVTRLEQWADPQHVSMLQRERLMASRGGGSPRVQQRLSQARVALNLIDASLRHGASRDERRQLDHFRDAIEARLHQLR